MITLERFLQLAGLLHFAILIASALVPRLLEWRANLALLPAFLRRLFWVYGCFIVLTILGFATLTLVHFQEMASGTPLGRSVCALIAVFWFTRLGVQWFVFDARPFLRSRLLVVGYHALTVAFLYLTAVYGWAAFRP